jgi:hypothetical protein
MCSALIKNSVFRYPPQNGAKDYNEVLLRVVIVEREKNNMKKHVDAEDKQILQKSQNATFDIPTRGLTIINESDPSSFCIRIS